MKIKNIFKIFLLLLLTSGAAGCEGEKDHIIINGNLPIKTPTLYLVGDATPNGWSIDAPTPMTPTKEDPLVFVWEGPLNAGEMKLCLATGSWDNPFIHPMVAGDEITKDGIREAEFDMYAGDPDKKWKVVDAGIYSLCFDLRNWTMSASYVREQDAPVVEPIEADALYMVGSSTPNEWNIDNPTELERKSDYVFVYEGPLAEGEMKACTTTGSWDVPFVRPAANGCKIGKDGVAEEGFVYTTGPDNKWVVETSGIYRITFDLAKWTIVAEYLEDFAPAPKLFMIGEATIGGWSWDNATVVEANPDNHNLFVWEGELSRGSLKASLEKDFNAPFYRPSYGGCEISESGVASNKMVHTTSPDDQWMVVAAGKYRLTFNIADMTFDAVYLDASVAAPALYMIGSATAGGWSLDDATEYTPTVGVEGEYTWTGTLKTGTFKLCTEKDFSAPFYRPSSSGCTVSKAGVSAPDVVYTTGPDDQWEVTEEGVYTITINIKDMTIKAEMQN